MIAGLSTWACCGGQIYVVPDLYSESVMISSLGSTKANHDVGRDERRLSSFHALNIIGSSPSTSASKSKPTPGKEEQ